MRNTLFIGLCCLAFLKAGAQDKILQTAINKITTCKSISYKVSEVSIDPFGGSDTHAKTNVLLYKHQTNGNNENYRIDINASYGRFRYTDNGRQQTALYFKDSTYIIKLVRDTNLNLDPLYTLVNNAKRDADNSKYKILMLHDSLINKTPCYHILVSLEDSAKSSYDRLHLFISKANYLILGSRSSVQGEMEKGGISLGTIKMSSVSFFSDYKFHITKPDPSLLKIPAGFKPQEKILPLLSKGAVAPDWELRSSDGQVLSMASLKGKVVLIDFTFNSCPACMLAVPSLKKLHQKYDGTDVAIISINTLDSKAEIAKFLSKNNIKSPVYVDGKSVSKAYHVHGGPNFFLIDKQGVISESYDGYFDTFDTEIPAKIEALR